MLLIIFVPAAAVAQLAGEQVQYNYNLNIDQVLNCYGISNDEKLVLINVTGNIAVTNPLVIMGSDAGILEKNSFYAYTGIHPLKEELIMGDGITSYNGNPLSYYDLILIGGPMHNDMTRRFTEQGLLHCEGTSIKMPGLVIEVGLQPNGRRVIVIGDVSGYAYHKKDLPLNGILPETLAPAAAIATGMGLGAIGAFLGGTGAVITLKRTARRYLSGFLNAHAAEAATETGTAFASRSLAREVLVLLACAILLGATFVIADRLSLQPDLIALYLVMGGLAMIVHDLGHRMVARKLDVDGENRFWGTGTIIMLLTSGLYGMAFAQPGRYAFADPDDLDIRDKGFIMMAGPAVSMLFAILFLPFALIGGVAGQVAVAGFTMNLMTAIYNLMPFEPMDGKIIYEWSRTFWMITFVPLALFFILMTLFFV